MEIVKYEIELSSGRAGGSITMKNIECSDWTDVNALADALASLMPEATYYCQKNSRYITQEWSGSVEVQTDERKETL
jgi:hypothetical protein